MKLHWRASILIPRLFGSQPDDCDAAATLAFSLLPRPAGWLTSITHLLSFRPQITSPPSITSSTNMATDTTTETTKTTRVQKGLEDYQGEGPKWRLGETSFTYSKQIANWPKSMHLLDRLRANKLHASVRELRSPKVSCVSARTRSSTTMWSRGGTWRGVIGECLCCENIRQKADTMASIHGRLSLTPPQALRYQVPDPRPQRDN